MFSHSSQSPLAACLHLHLSQISYYSTVLYFGRNDLHQQVPDLPFDVGSENGPRPDEMREMEEIPGAISMFRFLPFEWLQVVFLSKKEKEKEGRRKKEEEAGKRRRRKRKRTRNRKRRGRGKGKGRGRAKRKRKERGKRRGSGEEEDKEQEKDEKRKRKKLNTYFMLQGISSICCCLDFPRKIDLPFNKLS